MNNKMLYLRKRYNLKQLDIANYLNIPRKTYSDLEGEQISRVNFKHYIILALLYNVTLDYLVGLTDEKERLSTKKITKIIKIYSVDIINLNMLRQIIGEPLIILENNKFYRSF